MSDIKENIIEIENIISKLEQIQKDIPGFKKSEK